MKIHLIFVVLLGCVWLVNSQDCEQIITSTEYTSCLDSYAGIDKRYIREKFDETFLVENPNVQKQQQLLKVACDHIAYIMECQNNFTSIPEICIGEVFTSGYIDVGEYETQLLKYFCHNNLEKALEVIENNGVLSFRKCFDEVGGENLLLVLNNNRWIKNEQYCMDIQRGYDCLYSAFEAAQNDKMKTMIEHLYIKARQTVMCMI